MSPTRRQTKWDIAYKKHQFSHLQQAREVPSPQTLHGDRERRDNSKMCQSFFDPTYSFSCRGDSVDWPLTHPVNLILAAAGNKLCSL